MGLNIIIVIKEKIYALHQKIMLKYFLTTLFYYYFCIQYVSFKKLFMMEIIETNQLVKN